jgi:hypothetical protein
VCYSQSRNLLNLAKNRGFAEWLAVSLVLPDPTHPPNSSNAAARLWEFYSQSKGEISWINDNNEPIFSIYKLVLKICMPSIFRETTGTAFSHEMQDLGSLSSAQFVEFSTDVIDIMIKRSTKDFEPLLVQDHRYDLKRNEARQRLSHLEVTSFRDLALEILCEIERRTIRK